MSKPDYSAWLTPERLAQEEVAWTDLERATWPEFVAAVERVRLEQGIFAVKEFGCGTGLVPAGLPSIVRYVGVDANEECIARARARNLGRAFIHGDLRAISIAATLPTGMYGESLVCAFSVLKHFSIDEFDAVVFGILRHGAYGLFSMPVGPETKDDGVEFPHLWVTSDRLAVAVAGAEHVIVHTAPLPWGETLVETQREGW